MNKNQKGFAHPFLLLIFVIVVAAVGFVGWRVFSGNKTTHKEVVGQKNSGSGGQNLGDPNSTDPVTKGKSLSNGQCSGTGSSTLTHAPMSIKDIDNIQPYGLMIGGHVTPVDHQYYWGPGSNSSAKDAYPVYADGDGTIVSVGSENDRKWSVVISHNSCTFFSWYNLMTSLDSSIKSKLPASWGPNNNGGINIPIKSGQIIGRVGGQSLDFAVWDTTKSQQGLLYATAYNNREPWKVNTALPLDYFSSSVKSQILPKYIRTAAPRDGKLAYDVDGQAVGTWFLVGSNGYAGGDDLSGSKYQGHLSLAYDYVDPSAREFSNGNYQGQPTQFAVKGGIDWTKITPSSGLVKVELAGLNRLTGSGAVWMGAYATGIHVSPSTTQATALLQMTDKQHMKVEVFPGKTPAQVSGFDSKAKVYDRGQDAHMVQSSTATH